MPSLDYPRGSGMLGRLAQAFTFHICMGRAMLEGYSWQLVDDLCEKDIFEDPLARSFLC